MSKTNPKPPVRVGRSRTGLGLFATDVIKKGSRVMEYRGRKITTKQAIWLEDNTENRYVFEINDKWSIDGSPRWNLARYVNHSCRPNVEAYQYAERIFYRAKWNIQPGSEITVSYGRDYFSTFIKPIGCKCDTCIARRKRERAEARKKAARKAKAKKKNGKH
ncbi:MAG: SET domain-containing protein [Xanthobacteraceae bacterium]|jgi:SET domain-containing protein